MNVTLYTVVIVLSSILHFSIQKIFIYYKRFDDINHRSSHKTLATRTGGIGVFISLFLVSLFYYSKGVEIFDYTLFVPLGIMLIVGVYDDLYKADFKLKFFLQIIVAKILIDQGYVITNYFGLFGLYQVPWLLAQITTVFVFLVVVNAINFIDGIDGLAITQVIKTIVLIEFLSYESTLLLPIGSIIIISIIPLYYFNFKKEKKVFLGDGGSMFLGTIVMIYALTTLSPNYTILPEYSINKVILAILSVLYPLIDLLRVFIIRVVDGKSPFIADRRHLHHKVLAVTKHQSLVVFIILIVELFLVCFIYKMFL